MRLLCFASAPLRNRLPLPSHAAFADAGPGRPADRCVRARRAALDFASAARKCCAASTARCATRTGGPSPRKSAASASISTTTAFRIVFEARHLDGHVDFDLARPDRSVMPTARSFSRMEGEARASFARNRIGLCVLHPHGRLDRSASARRAGGRHSRRGAVSDRRLAASGRCATFARSATRSRLVSSPICGFRGDVFETEDQRNWSDASFKTYSTPLDLPRPVVLEAGTRVSQTVTLALRSSDVAGLPHVDSAAERSRAGRSAPQALAAAARNRGVTTSGASAPTAVKASAAGAHRRDPPAAARRRRAPPCTRARTPRRCVRRSRPSTRRTST